MERLLSSLSALSAIQAELDFYTEVYREFAARGTPRVVLGAVVRQVIDLSYYSIQLRAEIRARGFRATRSSTGAWVLEDVGVLQ